jgi:hypothetical protein
MPGQFSNKTPTDWTFWVANRVGILNDCRQNDMGQGK